MSSPQLQDCFCVLDLFTRWGTSSGAGSFDFLWWGRW